MRSNNKKAILTAFLSLLWLIAMSAVAIVIYSITKWLPLMLMSVALLLPASVTLVLLCFGSAWAESSHEAARPVDGAKPMKKTLYLMLRAWSATLRLLCRAYRASRAVLTVIFAAAAALGSHTVFWLFFPRITSVYSFTYLTPVILVLMFVSFLVVEKLCAHIGAEADTRLSALLKNLHSAFATGRLMLVLLCIAAVIKLLGFYDLQNIAVIAMAVVFCYESLFIVLSFASHLIKRELNDDPDVAVPVPFSGAASELGILGYLEKNTGITMRSLWSMKLIKRLLPSVVIAATLLFWLSTGVIQIEANQTGALYRMGKLEKTVGAGLHFTLPWPFDRVDVYDTGKVNRMTIGYISSSSEDNVWTSAHGANEYKLLMGSGNELVSINLRVEYKIDDLESYLTSSASPEKLLEAGAYELVTERTAESELNELLSVDRDAFTEAFMAELNERFGRLGTGLRIESVLLESIHPPLEIAESYQRVVSAGIQAETIKINALSEAELKKIKAETERQATVKAAEIARVEAIAEAQSKVSVFMANVEAFTEHKDAFRYYKYIETLRTSYQQTKLIIVGEGINSSNIYFGQYPTVGVTDTNTAQG